MIEIKKSDIESEDAKILIGELNQILIRIVGEDGTVHFKQNDVKQEHSFFLIGYIDGVPMGCCALRKMNEYDAEVKRVYARKNDCGLATSMIQKLEQYAISEGYQHLFLETRIQNTHAIAFYTKCGYQHCESFGVYKDNINSYCFTKEL